jgi:hypothetical protein
MSAEEDAMYQPVLPPNFYPSSSFLYCTQIPQYVHICNEVNTHTREIIVFRRLARTDRQELHKIRKSE